MGRLGHTLDIISHANVEARFNHITADDDRPPANRMMSLLRLIYR